MFMACCRRTASFVYFWSNSRFFFKTALPRSRLFCSFYCKIHQGFLHPHRAMSFDSNGAEINSTHLEKTENSPREESVTPATVIEISKLSETVKRLRLKVEDNRLIFKPGQWVDFFIPDVSTVGGFTICSSPREIQETSTIELAVKYSEHPPALWVHTKCCVGSKVHMRVGGEFYFDPNPDEPSPDLLLVAGGVGINPMYSIIQHVADISSDPRHQYTGKTTLLFSAKNQDELLFKDSLVEISQKCPSILCKFFVTKQERANVETEAGSSQTAYEHGRINQSRLQEAVSSLNRSQLICYICGPPPMIKHVSDILYKMNIAKNRIHFEKWW